MSFGSIAKMFGKRFLSPSKATILLFQYEDKGGGAPGGVSKTENTGKISISNPVSAGGKSAKEKGSAPVGNVSAASASLKVPNVKIPLSVPSIPNLTGDEDKSHISDGPPGNDAGMSYVSKMYTVAFNPESIKLTINGGGLREAKNYNSAQNGKSTVGATESITYVANERRNMSFSVKLIFDRVNKTDAFTEIDPSSVGLNADTAMAAVSLFNDYTVQPEVEGFIAAIQSDMTNLIRFIWGDMVYTGTFVDIQSQYTMFNPKGYPIRAELYLQLQLIDTELEYNYMGGFDDSFDAVFGKGNHSWRTISELYQ